MVNMITRKARSNRLVFLIGGLVCLAIYFFWRTHSHVDAPLQLYPLLLGSAAVAIVTFFLWWYSYKHQLDIPWWLVIGFALLFRLTGIGAFPILEDDMYRFLWDGRQTIETGSPYNSSPSDHFDEMENSADDLSEIESDRWDHILDSINYPDVGTVYGPTAQYGFALAYLLGAGEIWALQLVFSFADLFLIALLLAMTKARNVLLYAWSPLVVKEFAFSAHPDVLGALFLLLACFLMMRKYYILAGTAMALALGVKIFALIAAPLILVFNWRAWSGFILTVFLIALPFGLRAAWLPEGLSVMSEDWVFNAPIYLTAFSHVPLIYIKAIMALGLSVFCLVFFINTIKATFQPGKGPHIPRVDIVFAALILCLPAFNPWYMVWLLPFAALRPSLWAWLASVVVLLAYVSGINLTDSSLGLYQQPLWLVYLEFGLVGLVAILEHNFIAPSIRGYKT